MQKGVFLAIISFSCINLFAQDDYVLEDYKTNETNIIEDHYDKPNPDYTSYFMTPSAYTLTSRDFRFASNDIIFLKASYGFTNNTTASLNVSMFSSVVASVKQNIKRNETVSLSITASVGDLYAASEDTTVAFTGGSFQATIGDHQNNLTFGTGVYYIGSNIDIINEQSQFFFHTVNVGFQNQISKHIYFLAEGLYFTNYSVFTGGVGLKFVVKRKYSINVGAMPVLWNNIRTSRHDFSSGVIPFFSVRMLIERN